VVIQDEVSEEQTKQSIGQVEEQATESVLKENKLPVLTEKELSVSTDNNKKETPIPPANSKKAGDGDYINYQSRCVMLLDKLHEERDLWYSLSKFFDSKDEVGTWVSERYRCLIEVLLTFSEMKRIELDDLKEVCNAFTDVIRSNYFKCLHTSYPYIDEITELRNRIKSTCLKTNGEFIKYRLSKNQKQVMIITRFELSQFVPKRKFNELKFINN
jgi:hypothetical protein